MSKLQIEMAVSALVFFVIIILSLRKNSMSIKNSLAWLLLPLVFLIIAIFPDPIADFSALLGFEVFSNFIFLIIIGLLVIVCFFLTTTISRLQSEITKLAQEVAILKKASHDQKSTKK